MRGEKGGGKTLHSQQAHLRALSSLAPRPSHAPISRESRRYFGFRSKYELVKSVKPTASPDFPRRDHRICHRGVQLSRSRMD